MRKLFYIIPSVFFFFPIVLFAQTKSQIVYKIPVIVSDRAGRRVSGLRKEDFNVFQEGIKQNVSSLTTEDEPISVALLLDTSGSTQEILNKIKNAAKDFIDLLNPSDQCMIATFDSQINILSQFTSDKQGLKKSLDKIDTAKKDGTVMFNAISQISQNNFGRLEGRKAIVLLSDGKDFGSSISRRNLIQNLEESDVSIYPIYYQSGLDFKSPTINIEEKVADVKVVPKKKKVKKEKKKKGVYTIAIPLPGNVLTQNDIKLIEKNTTIEALDSLKELSDITAGGFYSSDSEKLSSIFKQVASELRQQYLLGILLDKVSTNNILQDISIRVNRQDLVVQIRSKLRK